MAESLITPKATAPASPAEVQPKDPSQSPPQADNLPDELLQLPALQALFAGEPPAVSAPIQEFQNRPEGKLIVENKDKLLGTGLALYRSLSGDLGVLFNQFYISPDDIKAADQAGRLQEIAPPFDAVSAQVGKAGPNNPVLKERQTPQGFATASVQAPPQTGSPIAMPGPTTSAQNKIVQERAKLIQPGKPTDRGGRGKLLDSILKPVA